MFEDKLAILESVFGDYVLQRQGTQAYFHCPSEECSSTKKKLNVNLYTNQFHCWVCLLSGQEIGYLILKQNRELADEWFTLNRMSVYRPPKYTTDFSSIELPDLFIPLPEGNVNSPYFKRCMKYLVKERGLTKKDIYKYNIGFVEKGEYQNYVIFPSYDSDAKLNYFVGRALYKNMRMRYKNPSADKTAIIFNEMFLDFRFPIFLVEGIFDMIKVGDNAVPLLGSSLNENYLLFTKLVMEKPPAIYLCLDKEAYDKQTRIANLLGGYGLNIYNINLNTYGDLGEIKNRKEIDSLVAGAARFGFVEKVKRSLNK